MRIALLTVLLILLPTAACAQEKGRVENGVVSANPNVTVMQSRRSVICLKLSLIDKIMKEQHGEVRVFAAETDENGADGFALFVGSNSWTAVELIKGNACIIQSGKFWAGSISLPGSSL